MFPIATFFAIMHEWHNWIMPITNGIIKNKNLPFVKIENRNVLNVQIKNSWTQFAHEK